MKRYVTFLSLLLQASDTFLQLMYWDHEQSRPELKNLFLQSEAEIAPTKWGRAARTDTKIQTWTGLEARCHKFWGLPSPFSPGSLYENGDPTGTAVNLNTLICWFLGQGYGQGHSSWERVTSQLLSKIHNVTDMHALSCNLARCNSYSSLGGER